MKETKESLKRIEKMMAEYEAEGKNLMGYLLKQNEELKKALRLIMIDESVNPTMRSIAEDALKTTGSYPDEVKNERTN